MKLIIQQCWILNSIRTRLLLVCLFLYEVGDAQIANGKNKFLGNIIRRTYHSEFTSYWNQVVPGVLQGNCFSIVNGKDTTVWNWAPLDSVYDYTQKNKMLFIEKNLVYGRSDLIPEWFLKLPSSEQTPLLETWFEKFSQRYPGTFIVSVVNEPLSARPRFRGAMGGDGQTGWDWMIWAFEKARKYFPGKKLLLNDNHILMSDENTLKYLSLIKLLQNRGLIDVIGCQGHFMEWTDSATIRRNLNLLSDSTGLPIYISEYNVNFADDVKQLNVYMNQLPVLWDHPAVIGMTLYGYREGDVWVNHPDSYIVRHDGSERPAMEFLKWYINQQSTKVLDNQSILRESSIQNYPNPSRYWTNLSFKIQQVGNVEIHLYDILGRQVRKIESGAYEIGTHSLLVNLIDLAGGTYFYHFIAPGHRETKILTILR